MSNNKLIKEQKDTISFHQTLSNDVYKLFYKHCKDRGVRVQERIRLLIIEDLKTKPI